MPDQCCVYKCSSRRTKKPTFSLHYFPKRDKSPERYQLWVAKINRQNFTPTKYSVVCSRHFEESNFEQSSMLKQKLMPKHKCSRLLNRNAVPSLFLKGEIEEDTSQQSLASTNEHKKIEAASNSVQEMEFEETKTEPAFMMETTEMKSESEEAPIFGSHLEDKQVSASSDLGLQSREVKAKVDVEEKSWYLDINEMKPETKTSFVSKSNLKNNLTSDSLNSLMGSKNKVAVCEYISREKAIKNDSWCLESVSSEMELLPDAPNISNIHFKKELISAYVDSIRESKNTTDNDEMGIKMEIKEEPLWPDMSTEITTSVMEIVLQDTKKETSSNADERVLASTETEGLSAENQCIYGIDISTFSNSAIFESKCCQEVRGDISESEYSNLFALDKDSITKESHMESTETSVNIENSISHSKKNVIYDRKNLDISNVTASKLIHLSPVKDCSAIMFSNKRQYVCKICEKSFTCSSSLRKHGFTHKRKRAQCKMCGKEFSRETYLKTHNLIHEGKRPHKCKICKKSYTLASYLKLHNMIHEGKKHHNCKICNKNFTTAPHLKKHALIHGERPHKCNVCEKRFALASALKTHKFIHNGESPHKCLICEKNFSRASCLRIHMLIHESNMPHKCDTCKKSFPTASHLKIHHLSHDGIRPHKCDVCEKGFFRVSHLKTHSLIHKGERPHKCKVCEKSFTTASNLRKHNLIHNGVKQHNCTICEKKFMRTYDLKRHSKTHVSKISN